ncbi:MAG: RES family NAD+ phosphorylase [Gammaproteobacteria bacterium]|nr:RES family NAD+ phosphorylase [Gammaproteobacteria bacterium]
MIRIYRICRVEHLENFEGHGASFRHGGRWNNAGVPVLYFAESAGVAMLEMANYLPSPRLVPATYRLGVYEVASSASIARWQVENLPEEWDEFPHSPWTQKEGTEWLLHGEESLLFVPSAAVPGGLENIVLASPQRLAPAGIRLVEALEVICDSRAFAER